MSEKRILIVAPHPDDELFGCGGTILRMKESGAVLGLLFFTNIFTEYGWPEEQVLSRNLEINKVKDKLGFDYYKNLNYPAALLDTFPHSEIISKVKETFNEFQPNELFIPHYGDIHSDHRICNKLSLSCAKWFRAPYLKNIFTYETLSETNILNNKSNFFSPNYFIDISNYIEEKLNILSIYKSELGNHPFPRSDESVLSLAKYRGSSVGFENAEAFYSIQQLI